MRIIDENINIWTCTVELHQGRLRRCHPSQEPREQALLASAQKALAALEEYRGLLDNQRPQQAPEGS